MTQFIILGMHRSGTSSVTKLVSMMGAAIGEPVDLVAANSENPKGFFERYDVIDINNRLLNEHDSHWFHIGKNEITQASDAIKKDITSLLAKMNQHKNWVIKDPRLCNTIAAWQQHLENPFLVITHRNPLEIATSLNKRNGFSIAHGIALWEYAAVGMLNAARAMPHHIISYADLMRDPVATTKALYDAISKAGEGLTCPADNEITGFIDPSLYRSKSDENNKENHLNTEQQSLVAMFETGDIPSTPLTPSNDAKAIMQEVSAYVPALAERESVKETLGHTQVTVEQQRIRIETLMKERDEIESKNKLIESDNDAKQKRIEVIESENNALGLAKAERDAIKQSRWWKLRSWLLREGGVSLKEVITRPK